jgi:hypothetical protein
MEFSKVLTLSTTHLHPLEAKEIHEVSYISGATCFLVSTDSNLHEHFIKGVELPCLVDLLKEVAKLYPDVDYVMFDRDANVEDAFRSYDW